MKKNKSAEDVLNEIRRTILALPPDQRRTIAEHLLVFLLSVREERAGTTAPATPAAGLTPEQQNLINALGEHTRHLRDQAGDDLYFFM